MLIVIWLMYLMNSNLVKQEWPEEIYPPYANGPGYIISSDIAMYIVSQHLKHSLRVCSNSKPLSDH